MLPESRLEATRKGWRKEEEDGTEEEEKEEEEEEEEGKIARVTVMGIFRVLEATTWSRPSPRGERMFSWPRFPGYGPCRPLPSSSAGSRGERWGRRSQSTGLD